MFGEAHASNDVDVYISGTANLLNNLRGLTTLKVEEHAIVKAVVN